MNEFFIGLYILLQISTLGIDSLESIPTHRPIWSLYEVNNSYTLF